jgi:hypothetical protein
MPLSTEAVTPMQMQDVTIEFEKEIGLAVKDSARWLGKDHNSFRTSAPASSVCYPRVKDSEYSWKVHAELEWTNSEQPLTMVLWIAFVFPILKEELWKAACIDLDREMILSTLAWALPRMYMSTAW